MGYFYSFPCDLAQSSLNRLMINMTLDFASVTVCVSVCWVCVCELLPKLPVDTQFDTGDPQNAAKPRRNQPHRHRHQLLLQLLVLRLHRVCACVWCRMWQPQVCSMVTVALGLMMCAPFSVALGSLTATVSAQTHE